MKSFEAANATKFWIWDSRTIESARKRTNRPLLDCLKYYQVSFRCIHGGRKFKARGVGYCVSICTLVVVWLQLLSTYHIFHCRPLALSYRCAKKKERIYCLCASHAPMTYMKSHQLFVIIASLGPTLDVLD